MSSAAVVIGALRVNNLNDSLVQTKIIGVDLDAATCLGYLLILPQQSISGAFDNNSKTFVLKHCNPSIEVPH